MSRPAPSHGDRAVELGVAAVAALVGIGISLLVIAATGAPILDAAGALLDGAFGGWRQTATTVARALPLILVALGWIVAFRAGRLNVGFGGQMIMAALGSAVCAALIPDGLPAVLALPLCLAAGVACGAGYAFIAAALWAWRGVNEVISTLLLELTAVQILVWSVNGPLQDPATRVARTKPLPGAARWPTLVDRTPLSAAVLLVVVAVVVVAFVLSRTTAGFRLRVTGSNELAARANGIRTRRVSVLALTASGALAGLAGANLLLGGESPYLTDRFSTVVAIGLTGIVVALLAMNRPLATVPAALLLAALQQGGGLLEVRLGVANEIQVITEALVLLAVACSGVLLVRRASRRVDTEPTPVASAAEGAAATTDGEPVEPVVPVAPAQPAAGRT